MKIYPILILVLAIAIVSGCSGNNMTGGAVAVQEGNKMKNSIAILDTSKGIIKFELFEDKAPITTKNFIGLANSGFYDGLAFHRYEPGFVIQGGDPNGDGTGGSGKTIQLEIHPDLRHVKGVVGMARSYDPNSASSQFYITLEDSNFLDDNYAVFGKVVEGMDNAEKLRAGDRINKVTIS